LDRVRWMKKKNEAKLKNWSFRKKNPGPTLEIKLDGKVSMQSVSFFKSEHNLMMTR
jgi:hypothetical protein